MTRREHNNPILAALHGLRTLTRMLDDDHANLAIVRSDGLWQLEQNGSVRRQTTSLPGDLAARLVNAVHRHGPAACPGNWWVHPLGGGPLRAIAFERRADAQRTGLSPHTLELLRSRHPPNANGLVFGNHGPARAALLLSLAQDLPQDLIVYIGPRPPVEPANLPILHLFPPRDDRDRSQICSLLRQASAVLFDGPQRPEDLAMLFPSNGVVNRWIAIDASTPSGWHPRLDPYGLHHQRFSLHIGLRASPAQSARLTYLAIADDHPGPPGEPSWNILLDADQIQPEKAALRLSAQITSPVAHKHDDAPPTLPISTEPEPDASADISEFDVASLMQDDSVEDLGVMLESGEIDVPGFVSRRFQELREASRGESTEDDTTDQPNSSSALRGERLDAQLPSLIADADIDELQIPEVQPEQLRQTMEGEVSHEVIERFRSLRRESSPADAPPPSRRILPRPLGDESSAAQLNSPDSSGQWRRVPSSSSNRRVIPVPTKRSDTGADTADERPAPTGLNRPGGPTEELEIDTILDDLKRRRQQNSDS